MEGVLKWNLNGASSVVASAKERAINSALLDAKKSMKPLRKPKKGECDGKQPRVALLWPLQPLADRC